MEVVILCGGMGTRLREETEFRPKPMVNIGSKPILWHIMKIYSQFGHKHFVLCLGYKGEVIKKYFADYALLTNDITVQLGVNHGLTIHKVNVEEDWAITLVNTGETALKGARLKRVEKYIQGSDFLATYGDGVAQINIDKLVDFHRRHGRLATLTGVRPPSLFGELQVNNGRAMLFVEKPQVSSGIINGGFFVFKREIFQYLRNSDDCDLERGPLEEIAKAGELMVYENDGSWACMDTFRDAEYLNQLWRNNKAFWRVWE